jgi:hypothetical protein
MEAREGPLWAVDGSLDPVSSEMRRAGDQALRAIEHSWVMM